MTWEALFLRPLLLVVIALLSLRIFRIQHAASQHAVWMAVLVAMALTPIFSAIAPHYELEILPPTQVSASETVALRMPATPVEAAARPDVDIEPLLLHEQGRRQSSINAERISATALSTLAVKSTVSPFVYIYAIGLLILVSYRLIGSLLLRRVLKRSHPLRSRILRISDDVAVPAAVGVFRPAVLLPGDWHRLNSAVRRAILAHEFAHIRRKDLLTGAVAHLVECLLWFNPLAWWVARKVSRSAEMACDAIALNSLMEPADYSRILVDFAGRVNRAGHRISLPGLAMADSSDLSARIGRYR